MPYFGWRRALMLVHATTHVYPVGVFSVGYHLKRHTILSVRVNVAHESIFWRRSCLSFERAGPNWARCRDIGEPLGLLGKSIHIECSETKRSNLDAVSMSTSARCRYNDRSVAHLSCFSSIFPLARLLLRRAYFAEGGGVAFLIATLAGCL